MSESREDRLARIRVWIGSVDPSEPSFEVNDFRKDRGTTFLYPSDVEWLLSQVSGEVEWLLEQGDKARGRWVRVGVAPDRDRVLRWIAEAREEWPDDDFRISTAPKQVWTPEEES